MRKFYTLLTCFFIGIAVIVAQSSFTPPNMIPINQPYNYNNGKAINNKTVNCTDTVRYPGSKLTGLVEADTMDISTYIGAVSQAYHYNGTGIISGISAYVLLDLDGVPGNKPPIVMTIKVYNIDAQNYPTTMIASTDVQVMDVGFAEQPLMFSVPVAVSDSFAVALEINPSFPANPYYVTNTSVNNDGNMEALSCVTYLGVWYNGYIDFAGWDMDLMLAPIFNETYSASYTMDTNDVCLGNSILFTNATVPHNNLMFHPTPETYSLDLGDLNSAPLNPTYSHTYASSGTYTTDLTATLYGHTNNCVENLLRSVNVFDTSIAYFGYSNLGGGNYQFSDSSTAAVSWSWTFQGGSPSTSIAQNPTVTFATSGNYEVCLTVTDSNGCNMNTYCDSISFASNIDDYYAPAYVNVYPIPANKIINMEIPANYSGGTIVITDVVGQQLKSVAIEEQEKVKIETVGIASGIYFISVDYNNERVYTRRIVIDK